MNKIQLRFIRVALKKKWKLTAFECEFLDSVQDKGADHDLSDKQNKILNQIQRKTS
jgi:disulfide oxidoreductase YuzD